MNFVTSYTGARRELSPHGERDRARLHTLLVQQNVQALLVAVLLELSVGDELGGHGGTVGMEEEGGGTEKSDRDERSDGRQMRVALYEQGRFPRGEQDYAASTLR